MTIELTGKHALLFTLLFAIQTAGLWITLGRDPILADLPRSMLWACFFMMVPGSAFLTTIVVMELLRVALHKNRG
ncbi:MAG: hypothetical protein WCA13_10945 [Terriglobales bacterium]